MICGRRWCGGLCFRRRLPGIDIGRMCIRSWRRRSLGGGRRRCRRRAWRMMRPGTSFRAVGITWGTTIEIGGRARRIWGSGRRSGSLSLGGIRAEVCFSGAGLGAVCGIYVGLSGVWEAVSDGLFSVAGGEFAGAGAASDCARGCEAEDLRVCLVRCHRVAFCSTAVKSYWNQVVSYLTGGLLYGREVEKPDWFTLKRKREYRPCINAAPSKRRPEVMEMVLRGMTFKQIGAKLGIKESTAFNHAKAVYKLHGVRGRKGLAKKLGRAPAEWETKIEKIRVRLAAGMRYDEVALELKTSRHDIAHYAAVLRRMGIEVAYQGKPSPTRDRIGRLFLQGFSTGEIAKMLKINRRGVRRRLAIWRARNSHPSSPGVPGEVKSHGRDAHATGHEKRSTPRCAAGSG